MQAGQQIGNRYGVTARLQTSTQNEVQTLTGGATSGTFRLQFGTVQSGILNFNDSAATIQAALRLMSNIAPLGVACTGGPLNTTPVVCTFSNQYAGVDVPLLQVVSINLAGGTVTPSATTAPATKAYSNTNLATITDMRTALGLIDGTTFTSAVLDKMSFNDMTYAVRQLQDAQTV